MRRWRQPRDPTWSKTRVAAAYRLIQTPMGHEAVSDGWICALWDFIRENNRLPERSEADEARARSVQIWASLPPSALAAARAKADRLARVVTEQA